MKRCPYPVRWVSLLALAALVSGCSADINVRGNVVDRDKLASIRPGVQDRSAVRNLLGSPTNVSTFSNETWYYISQRDRSIAFSKPTALSRDIVAIKFDRSDRVAEVKRLSLANARNIKPVDRKTPTPGREFSILEQLIGNLGRFEGTKDSGL